MLVLIRGAGDLASGIALRLYRAGFAVVMTDLPQPTAIRRTVSFSQALRFGNAAAVQSLRADTSCGAVVSMEECLEHYDALPSRLSGMQNA